MTKVRCKCGAMLALKFYAYECSKCSRFYDALTVEGLKKQVRLYEKPTTHS